ncbi:MAG: hypothetical protein ABI231_05110 [Candidatus Tumulicola sp.]
MRMFSSAACLFSLATAMTMLAACNGNAAPQSAAGGTGFTPNGDARLGAKSRRSWMAPGTKRMDLLYVSDLGAGDVEVYSYPGALLKGTLTGFTSPHGECADRAGNVYVTDGVASRIVEYAHGGTKPIRIVSDAGYSPSGCAVDPTTGDLAVTNYAPFGSGPGNVSIYEQAKVTPKTYTNSSIYYYYYCGYDDKGNLYVDGTASAYQQVHFGFAELRAGGKALETITLAHTFNHPGGVQWDGRYVAVGDQTTLTGPSTVYEFSIKGTSGMQVAATPLTTSCDALQFWIEHDRIVVPNVCSPNVMYFAYPAGGTATKTIHNGLTGPVGTAISVAS